MENLEDLPLEFLHVLSLDVEERGRRGDELDQRRLWGHLVGFGGAVAGLGRCSHVPSDAEAGKGVEGVRALDLSVSLNKSNK